MSAIEVTRHEPGEPPPPGARFYFDLASPEAYLVAERILQAMPVATEWVPVRSAQLPAPESYEAFRCEQERESLLASFADRIRDRGLQPFRAPDPFPFDSDLALRAATFAKFTGRIVPFSLAAFRQAFAGGHALSREEIVLLAGSACELHPRALLTGVETMATTKALDEATQEAVAHGAQDVPAIWVPDPTGAGEGRVFHGEGGLDEAAAAARPPES